MPPEEQAKLDAVLERRVQERDAGKGILVEEAIEEMRMKRTLPPAERDRFEAEYNAEIERRFAQAVPGGCIMIRDFLLKRRLPP